MTATKHESSLPHSLGVMLVVAESVAEQPDQFNLRWEWYLKTGNRLEVHPVLFVLPQSFKCKFNPHVNEWISFTISTR